MEDAAARKVRLKRMREEANATEVAEQAVEEPKLKFRWVQMPEAAIMLNSAQINAACCLGPNLHHTLMSPQTGLMNPIIIQLWRPASLL